MRKLYIVKNKRDFDRIIKNGRYRKNNSYVIYYEKKIYSKKQPRFWKNYKRG